VKEMVKIMIVDDSAFMRKIVRGVLEKLNYTDIIEAGTGKDAISRFKNEKPDLILLDIIMPDIGGIDVLREIKGINPAAKVIMVTAIGQNAMIEECTKLGAICYIVKPFDERKITEAVQKALK